MTRSCISAAESTRRTNPTSLWNFIAEAMTAPVMSSSSCIVHHSARRRSGEDTDARRPELNVLLLRGLRDSV